MEWLASGFDPEKIPNRRRLEETDEDLETDLLTMRDLYLYQKYIESQRKQLRETHGANL